MNGSRARFARLGFSTIELLVVIGIITLSLGLLLPTLSRAHRQARSIQCQSNLRVVGQMLAIYQNQSNGWLFPVGLSKGKPYPTFGTRVPPHLRWPMKVFPMPDAPLPPAYDEDTYSSASYEPLIFPAEPYTPKVLVCPADSEPYEGHSYVLNAHLCEHEIRVGQKRFGGLTAPEVILAGEKRTLERDYFLQTKDFDRLVERYRHGLRAGTNFLFLDGHVDAVAPRQLMPGVDPWDVAAASPPK
jgi:prepilin-type processing-associated H-X9-DG protein